MSAIKEFFKKKKVEAQFKLAGGGQKLGDASSAQASSAAAAAAAARSQPRSAAPRQHPTVSAQQAGAAALNRIAAAPDKEGADFQRARQRALIKEQARKELEREQQIEAEIEKLKSVYGDKEPEVREAPEQLASQGILFKCPLVGEEALPRDQMKARIKDFLYAQLSQEQGLTAVLIIHTCNSPRERVETAIETLTKALNNIILNPTEEKYRKIRRSNKVFREKVGSLEGSEDFLLGCGFKVAMLPVQDGPEEEFWVLPEAADIDHLIMMKESLISAEPLTAELHRDIKVFPPGTGNNAIGALPAEFFSVSADEVKREQKERTEMLERESMLRTKAMREKEAAGSQRKYRYCLMRVRFPDGYIIQGTFAVSETLQALMEFVQDQLETPLPFLLVDSVTGKKLANDTASLQELGLVPASLLNFSWSLDIQADMEAAGAGKIGFLKSCLLSS